MDCGSNASRWNYNFFVKLSSLCSDLFRPVKHIFLINCLPKTLRLPKKSEFIYIFRPMPLAYSYKPEASERNCFPTFQHSATSWCQGIITAVSTPTCPSVASSSIFATETSCWACLTRLSRSAWRLLPRKSSSWISSSDRDLSNQYWKSSSKGSRRFFRKSESGKLELSIDLKNLSLR